MISDETSRKRSEALKGRKYSEEHKRHISEARLGKHPSKETCMRMSESQKGKTLSDETKRKIGIANLGRVASEEKRKKISAANSGENHPLYGKRGKDNPRFGQHHSVEARRKMGDAHRGEKCSLWKGGISFEPYCPKFNDEFKERVRAFFGYCCVECGTPQNGYKLHVHHVNFNKQSCCDQSIPLFIPLCKHCHTKTNSNREHWEQHFTEIIMGYYQGRCYLSQAEILQLCEV